MCLSVSGDHGVVDFCGATGHNYDGTFGFMIGVPGEAFRLIVKPSTDLEEMR